MYFGIHVPGLARTTTKDARTNKTMTKEKKEDVWTIKTRRKKDVWKIKTRKKKKEKK